MDGYLACSQMGQRESHKQPLRFRRRKESILLLDEFIFSALAAK